MNRIAVAAIVEGHGEQQSAVRTLVSRIWTELLGGYYAHVLVPIRRPRHKVVKPEELLKAIDLAELKLRVLDGYDAKLILVLLDADADRPCELGPQLLKIAQTERSHLQVSVVIANVEFETWFVGAASSLTAYFDLEGTNVSTDPETARQGKGTVLKLTRGRYGETVDQPRFSATMDLNECRRRCPSFDKLCRELAKYLS
jgi:hypothetical protein